MYRIVTNGLKFHVQKFNEPLKWMPWPMCLLFSPRWDNCVVLEPNPNYCRIIEFDTYNDAASWIAQEQERVRVSKLPFKCVETEEFQ